MIRQVPTKEHYLIIGRGRLAKHLAYYLDLKNIPYLQWSRIDSQQDLRRFLVLARVVFLAISDDAIEPFIKTHQLSPEKTVHFSGALATPLAQQLHPLMTFSHDLYEPEVYEKMSFISSQGATPLTDIIPELQNSHFIIPSGSESFYHALCVLGGNGTTLLWQTLIEQFQNKLAIPPEALWPYLEQIIKNLRHHTHTALTGPWVRNDLSTIQKNVHALQNHSSLQNLYHSLNETYKSQNESKGALL